MDTSGRARGLALNLIDIVVLTGFAIAQPLFSLLAHSAGFFLLHRSKPADLLLLVALTYAVPAGVALLVEWPAMWKGPRAGMMAHHVLLSVLLTINMLPLARRTGLPAIAALVLAAAAGVFLAVVYLRVRTWRFSLVYLSPTVLLFPALLLVFSPASAFFLPGRPPEKISARADNPVPIVMVVFDEFPLASLLDKDGQVDAQAYPNFARLAREGTWYRNASTAGESTLLALPAILSGRYADPDKPRLPDAQAYPYNLFTLLGGAYRLNVNENNTRMCPDELCAGEDPPGSARIASLLEDAAVLSLYATLPADFTGPLPDITQSWGHFHPASTDRPTRAMWRQFDEMTDWHDRPRQFRQFVDSIRPAGWPALSFLHILLPHAPWVFLPSGQRCMRPEPRIRGLRGTNDAGDDPNRWTGDAWAVAQSYQRHLQQVEYVDRLVGSLVKHLRDTGMYGRTLLILTADHGTSFRAGDSRRAVTPTNAADILRVPLFIKYPQQQEGSIDDRNVENVDILPTILDVIKLKTRYRPDGRSLLGPPVAERLTKTVVTDKELALHFPGTLDGLFASVRWKQELFGGGLYHLGDRYGWIGRPAPASAPEAAGLRYRLNRDAYYANVNPGGPTVLTWVSGQIEPKQGAAPLDLAVAVNGTVRAVTHSYRDGGEEKFAALVPPDALRRGSNDIAVFSVLGASALRKLERIGSRPYEWGRSLRFGSKGDAAPFYGIGWGVPEEGITWTDGRLATLDLPVTAPAGDVVLTAHLAAFVAPGKLDRQAVRVLVNHREVARWTVTGEFADFTAAIPKDDFLQPAVEIAFELPDAKSPIELGTGLDSRTLGLAVNTLTLDLKK
jgi:hypothetical protein